MTLTKYLEFIFQTFFQSVVREGYLKEMIQVLSDPRYGSNLSQVEATVKKHEAISADILARVSKKQTFYLNLFYCSFTTKFLIK